MLDFYKKTLTRLIFTLVISTIMAYLCIERTFLNVALLPNDKSDIRCHLEALSDNNEGGTSISKLNDALYSLDHEFTVTNTINYPSASMALVFEDAAGKPSLKDLSHFNRLRFMIKCSIANELTFIALP